MPESRCTTHSVWKPKASLPTVTCPENPPSKYFSSASRTRALMRSRRALPTSMFLPDTRKGIVASDFDRRPIKFARLGRFLPIDVGLAPTPVNATPRPKRPAELGDPRAHRSFPQAPKISSRNRELIPPALHR